MPLLVGAPTGRALPAAVLSANPCAVAPAAAPRNKRQRLDQGQPPPAGASAHAASAPQDLLAPAAAAPWGKTPQQQWTLQLQRPQAVTTGWQRGFSQFQLHQHGPAPALEPTAWQPPQQQQQPAAPHPRPPLAPPPQQQQPQQLLADAFGLAGSHLHQGAAAGLEVPPVEIELRQEGGTAVAAAPAGGLGGCCCCLLLLPPRSGSPSLSLLFP